MKAVSLTLCFCFLLSSGLAQPRRSARLMAGPTRLPSSAMSASALQSPDTLRLLALMVEFKEDIDTRTSGDGSFLVTGSPNQLDPPPHDSSFVADKLRFLSNYYARVSNGALIIQADVFSSKVRLADSMSAYSPQRAGSSDPLGNLIVDSWTAANDSNSSFPFSLYDAFVLFHAGVGRDINIISILGYDPTPYDLPSLYIDLPSLRELLHNPAYQGVPVNGGAFRISHSMILPESETRVFTSGSQTDTLQLSTNGLLAASVGSFLGLPDLFDTKTGRSGIGQFGLMDGAAIFAYSGLFPPEPSAWEKIRLGWLTPIVLSDPVQTVSLPAVGLTNAGQDSVLKIPITPTEYFLIENRSRDPQENGQTLTLKQGGVEVTRLFTSDTAGFFFNDVRAINGSVIDAEDFDWALSGDMTQQGLEGGGLLIWHIDEAVIAENLTTNTVNADPTRRGVDLEEADGSQDIGQAYEFLQPGSGTEVGWPLDCWFAGNQAPVYRNVFDASTFPDSRSNGNALSFVALRNFGAKAARMSVDIAIGSTEFRRMNGLSMQLYPLSAVTPPTVIPTAIILSSDDSVFVFQKNGQSKTGAPGGLLSPVGGRSPLASYQGSKTYIAGAQDSTVFLWDLDTTTAGVSSSVTMYTASLGTAITSGPMILDSLGTAIVIVGTANGSVWKVGLDGSIHGSLALSTLPITGLLANPTAPGTFYSTTQSSIMAGAASAVLPSSVQGWMIVGGQIPGGILVMAVENRGKRIIAFDGSLATRLFEVQVEDTLRDVIFADVDFDGRNDVVATGGSKIFAFNLRGVQLDSFPYRTLDGEEFSGSPLAADIDGDGKRDLAIRSTAGAIYAFASGGRMISGFPFQISPRGAGSLNIFETAGGLTGIMSVNESGTVAAWELNRTYNTQQGDWNGHRLDAGHTGFNIGPAAVPGPRVNGFLPKERVYNWPNPVYGSSTNIRYFTSEPSKIVVRIFDLAGESVTELKGDSPGGIDGEIVWDVSGIQSGVYFAHVEASAGGRTDAIVFKIAVVK